MSVFFLLQTMLLKSILSMFPDAQIQEFFFGCTLGSGIAGSEDVHLFHFPG